MNSADATEEIKDKALSMGVKGDKEHPYNMGWLCAKGRAAIDFLMKPTDDPKPQE